MNTLFNNVSLHCGRLLSFSSTKALIIEPQGGLDLSKLSRPLIIMLLCILRLMYAWLQNKKSIELKVIQISFLIIEFIQKANQNYKISDPANNESLIGSKIARKVQFNIIII